MMTRRMMAVAWTGVMLAHAGVAVLTIAREAGDNFDYVVEFR